MLLKEKQNRWENFTELILSDQRNEACAFFISQLKGSIISLLTREFYLNHEEANSLLHDAYLEIERKVEKGNILIMNKTYAHKYCINLARNLSRKNNTYLKHINSLRAQFNQDAMEYLSIELFPENYHFEHEKKSNVLKAYDQLCDRCKEIIKLKHIEDLNHKEIVSKLDNISSEDVSRTTLKRCIKKFKDLIKDLK